jgi:hypothetical protein
MKGESTLVDGTALYGGQTALRLTRRAVLLSAAALPLAGCWGDERVVKRVKVIAKAEVDGKVVEGSSVAEVQWRPRGDGGMDADEQGEAVVLELAGKGTVYILSMTFQEDGFDNTHIWPSQVSRAVGLKGGIHKEDLPKIESLKGRFAFIPRDKFQIIPVIVAFKDETEFRSIYRVLPEDFSKHFGAGVKFLGVEFEVTDEPVSEVLAKRLPMLLQPARGATDKEIKDSNGNRLSFKDKPFQFKIGTMTFFSQRRF